jgi:hypothetical protein
MRYKWPNGSASILLLAAALAFVQCGTEKKVSPVSVMDRPEVHYDLGMKKLESQEIKAAISEFQRAVDLDPKYSPAYSGLAIASAMNGEEKAAYENLEKAKKEAKKVENKLIYHTAAIRVETALLGENWLDKSKDHYEKGSGLEGGKAELTYFYGVANESAQEFDAAMGLYRQVIDMKEGRVIEADQHWKQIQDILRAQPGSSYGREMASREKVTKAELCVLLLEEIQLDELFRKRAIHKASNVAERIVVPYDVQDHELRNAVLKLMPWKLRGLDTTDNMFHPDKAVTRGEFSMLAEDIMIKISGDDGLATRYITESESPFSDLESSSPYFNSAMVTTIRGMLRANSSAQFRTVEPISGADVLLALRGLSEYRW